MPIPVQPARYTSTFDPALEQATQNLLSQKQQRYDTTFGALAEEQARLGEMFFMDENAKQLAMKSFDKRKEDILKQYEGDYGAASKALTNLVVSERNNPIYNLNKYQQQKMAEFQQLESKYGPNLIVNKAVDRSLIDEEGNVKSADAFNYDAVERSDYDKMLVQGNTAIMQNLKQSGLLDSQTEGFLLQTTEAGWNMLSKEQQNKIIKASGDILDKQSTFSFDTAFGNSREKQNVSGEEYAREALPRLFGSKLERRYIGEPTPRERGTGDDESLSVNGVIYEGGLVNDPSALTPKTFNDANPNIRDILSKQAQRPLQQYEYKLSDYSKGNISLAEYQSYQIEKNLRNSDPKLQELWKQGIETDEEIAKRIGYKGFGKTEKKTSTTDEKLPLFIEEKEKRNMAAKEYSNVLKTSAEQFIINNQLDTDFGIVFYQPDFTTKGVSQEYNNWSQNIKQGFTKPGQFQFLDGEFRGNVSSDDINKSYKNKESADFQVLGVGGNEETGLIWKVTNPDGTISNAKWNTGYKKQASYINKFAPQQIEALNASVVNISSEGIISSNYPDAPVKFTDNIKNYGFTAEEGNSPNSNYLRAGNKYITVKVSDGRLIPVVVDNKEEASPLPKGAIYAIISQMK